MVIRNGTAGGDAAHAINDAGAGQHGFAEHGFSGGSMAHDGEVADFSRWILFHKEGYGIGLSHSALILARLNCSRNVKRPSPIAKPEQQANFANFRPDVG